jgi:hypothetical protein
MWCGFADCWARVPQAVRLLYGGSAYGLRFAGFQPLASAKPWRPHCAWGSARGEPFGQ